MERGVGWGTTDGCVGQVRILSMAGEMQVK